MLSYFHSAGLRETYEALKRETDNGEFEVDDPKAKWVGLLEKKWTSVIRLQKKVRMATAAKGQIPSGIQEQGSW